MNNQKNTMNEEQQNQDPIIRAGEKDYKYSEMTKEEQLLVNHVADLSNKIATAAFNIDQLQFAKAAFESKLQQLLENPAEEVEAEED